MANVRGNTDRTRSRIAQEFVPSSAWTEDSNGHYLLVDLPAFKKEEVKLQLDSSGQITISGERQVNDNKYVYFEQTFKLLENSDFDKITGKFDGEILYVTVPKHVVEKKEEPEGEKENVNSIVEEKPNNSDENLRENDEKHGEGHGNRYGKQGKSEKNSRIDSFNKELLNKWGKEPSQLERAIKMLKNNKGIVFTAVVAFSLGVLIARNFESAGK